MIDWVTIRQHSVKYPLAWSFFFLTLLLHIIWPLTNGATQSTLTTLAVITLALSSWFSALSTTGIRKAFLMVLLVSALAFAVERVGSTTGFPFGDYSYTNALQPTILGVPLAVILAWFAMTWVMCVFVLNTNVSILSKSLIAGLLLTAWDFYLDPQMTEVGYWLWGTTSPSLPGIPGIPLTNYLGWFISGTVMSFILLLLLRGTKPPRLLAKVVLLWTIIGGFILHAIFWNNLAVGLWGIVSLGILWTLVERLSRST